MSLLQARQLAFAHGRRPVFEDLDFEIQPREIVCLVGPSGGGKSTLLQVLAGLAPAAAGEVRLQGGPIRSGADGTGVVFQAPTLLPWLTVAENVAFGLRFGPAAGLPRAERQRRVAAVLSQVGLTEDAHLRPDALSGGMAQRVALARALAREPALIFLDEPFSALDALTREAMQDLLLAVAAEHRSAVLMVTHDLDEALRIADRIVLLKGSPSRLSGDWRPQGRAPRVHRSAGLNALRETLLDALGASTLALQSAA